MQLRRCEHDYHVRLQSHCQRISLTLSSDADVPRRGGERAPATYTLVIAAIQANPTLGAIAKNEALARELMTQARGAGADLAVFTELFLNGYPPEDLSLKPAFWGAGKAAIERLAKETDENFAALIGVIWPAEAPGVKIGPRAFGRDRRYPIVNGFRDVVS